MVSKAPQGKCDECTLKNNVFVPSELHTKSKILALAEAPGYHEAQDGRPLVGLAGQDMNRIIEGLNYKREDINFMNAVSCRPTKIEDGKTFNRTPTDNEIMWCNARMIQEIEALSPTVIVCMGKSPYIALGGNKGAMMNQVAGTRFTWRDRFDVIVTYHPAAIAHSGGVTSQRGKMIRDNIEQAFKLAFESKPHPRQLKLL